MACVNGKRRENWKNLALKIRSHHRTLPLIQLLIIKDIDMLFRKAGQEFVAPVQPYFLNKGGQFTADSGQLLLRRTPIMTTQCFTGSNLIFYTRQANHNKLIKIRLKNRNEFDTF